MIFNKRKIIGSINELENTLNSKNFITYANVNSFRVKKSFLVKFNFLADGWPVSFYSSIIKRKKIGRLSFFKARQFWINASKKKKCALIGYSENQLQKILVESKKHGIEFVFSQNGFGTKKDTIKVIEDNYNSVDIIFLGMGQPKQEELLESLFHLEGDVSLVCCGAFWLQEFDFSNQLSVFSTKYGLVPLKRFYNNPFELIRRTLFSLPFMFLNLK